MPQVSRGDLFKARLFHFNPPSQVSRALVISLLLILAGILVPFGIWGARFDAALSLEGTREWMAGYGDWAWLAGLLLLASDIILPVPSTVVKDTEEERLVEPVLVKPP